MTVSKLRHVFLIGAGMTVAAGPAFAQQDCASRIDQLQSDLDLEQMEAAQQERVQSLIQGAQEFAEQDQQQACLDTLAQVRDLVGDGEEVAIGPDEQAGGQQQAATGQPPMEAEGGAGGITAETLPDAERQPSDMTAVGSDEDRQPDQAPPQQKAQADQPTRSQTEQQLQQLRQQVQAEQQGQQQSPTGQPGQPQQQAQSGQQDQQPQTTDQQAQQDQQQQARTGQQDPEMGGGPAAPREQLEAQAKYGPLAWLSFDQVIGAEVQDQSGATVAEIIALVRDRQDGQFFAVLNTGQAGEMVVPMDQLELGDQQQIALSEGADQTMQQFEADEYESVR